MKLDELKKKIQEANPEIMELKFGCEIEILFDDSDFYGKVKPYWVKRPIYQVSEKKAVIYIVQPPFPNNAIEVQKRLDNGELKILGRPIRLADVLIAISQLSKSYQIYINADGQFIENTAYGMPTKIYWNLKSDNLDDQSQETIDFLYNLICK